MRIVPHVDVFLMCSWGEVTSMSSYSTVLIDLLFNNSFDHAVKSQWLIRMNNKFVKKLKLSF